MLNKKALAATAAADKLYVEDVFSTYLFTGTGSSQTITNNIDLSTEGGLVWTKRRDASSSHGLYDTLRGTTKRLRTNTTDAEDTLANSVTAFNTDGFSIGSQFANAETYASWTFRKAEKFFDVVTYTGNGTAGRTVSHNLGSVPGMIIVKSTDGSGQNWCVYHRSAGADKYLYLNTTSAQNTDTSIWNNTSPTSSVFSVGGSGYNVNDSGFNYVAYLFAHDAGGFGDSGSDNVISCGTFTTPSSGLATIELGYEPQWLMVKCSSNTGDWWIVDNMRGFSQTFQARLDANASWAEETTTSPWFKPTATGFTASADSIGGSRTHIYIAIRRGPMKTPTTGTSVFYPLSRTGTGGAVSITGVGFPPDMTFRKRSGTTSFGDWPIQDKLRGVAANLFTNLTGSESDYATQQLDSFDQDGISYKDNAYNNTSSTAYINYYLRRAPGFFDVVCYTGTGANRTVTHNLGVAPELMIVKRRDSSTDGEWIVYVTSEGATKFLNLSNQQASSANSTMWNNTSPTSSQFTVGTSLSVSSGTYVSYLFSSVSGVSKIGSYTGTGNLLQINCGFTSSARFVLIKRTDSDGAWFVYDSARGIVAGNDPYLLLNSTAAEVTNTDYIDTYSSGFELTSDGSTTINVNNASYIYLAIA